MRLVRPITVVLQVDRHPVINLDALIEALGYESGTVQTHEVQTQTPGWRIWRVYPNVGPVDHVPPLTPAELKALENQPGILGVWLSR